MCTCSIEALISSRASSEKDCHLCPYDVRVRSSNAWRRDNAAVAMGTGWSWQHLLPQRSCVGRSCPAFWGSQCGPFAVRLKSTINVTRHEADVVGKWKFAFMWWWHTGDLFVNCLWNKRRLSWILEIVSRTCSQSRDLLLSLEESKAACYCQPGFAGLISTAEKAVPHSEHECWSITWGSFNSEEELIQSWYKTKKLVVLLINVWMHILFSCSIINPKISKHTRSCCVRYLLECLTTCVPFEKAEDGFQSHKNSFKFRAWRRTNICLSALNEGTLLADAEEIFFHRKLDFVHKTC